VRPVHCRQICNQKLASRLEDFGLARLGDRVLNRYEFSAARELVGGTNCISHQLHQRDLDQVSFSQIKGFCSGLLGSYADCTEAAVVLPAEVGFISSQEGF
jgi:hypothetical protein